MAEELKDLEGLINKCVLCGGCHPDCPTYKLSRYEHDAARGKVVLAGALLKGEVAPGVPLAETFDHCLACMACVEACPAGANPVRVIIAARNEVRKRIGRSFAEKAVFGGLLRHRFAMPLLSAAMKIGKTLMGVFPRFPGARSITREGRQKFLPDFSLRGLKSGYPAVIPATGTRVARVGYFTGCMTDWVFKEAGADVIRILSSAGAEVVLLKDELCCGAPAYFAGDSANAERLARKNIKTFLDGEFDFIVTSCATCGSVLKEIYPLLVPGEDTDAFSAKITDFQKLLVDHLIENLVIPDTAGETVTVTYHDPCHLSRGMKVVKEPRELLKMLPGVKFVEMKEANACCGGAGTFSVKYYEDSLEIGKRKAVNIRESGAQIVVTECPSCQMQLSDIVARYCPGVRVMHTAELLSTVLQPSNAAGGRQPAEGGLLKADG